MMWGFMWLAALVGFCVWRWVVWLDWRDEEWLRASLYGEDLGGSEDWAVWEVEMAGSDGWHEIGGDV